ncbi:hypothetical protein MLD38_037703 [Melastoma candidum]|uniref:Uncharacterized protein n=1 Tax=Melastoma candidum TaxID=119954 RepID=A0ACB9LNG9_9MYRT|nr:hypothetical protein MLD38_037703 [Melastoma candidum]
MRHSRSANSLEYNPEIEQTCHALRKEAKPRKQQEKMALENRDREDHKALGDYVIPSVGDVQTRIWRPAIAANNFEIKPAIIQLVQNKCQFGGSVIDEPNADIASFFEVCDTSKSNGVSDDAIRQRLFSFSLRDKAKAWLYSLTLGSITTWDDLSLEFLTKIFPPMKTVKLRRDITTFMKLDGRACTRHGNTIRNHSGSVHIMAFRSG